LRFVLAGSPAVAKDWMEYAYPDRFFTLAFSCRA